MMIVHAAFMLAMFAADVSGTWNVTVRSDAAGTIKSMFVFNQKDEILTGTYKGSVDGKVEGALKGNDVSITVYTPRGVVKFQGKLDAAGRRITGTYENVGRGMGSFTADKAATAGK